MTRHNAITVLAAALIAVTCMGGTAAAAPSPTPATTSLIQSIKVSWKKGKSAGKDSATFAIRGIGTAEIVCKRDAAYLRLTPTDRRAETNMWSILEQEKNGVPQHAVKNARIYTFGTPTAPSNASGSGPNAQEGLNQENMIEDSGKGYAYGLISQRTALNAPAAATAPLSWFVLSWKWSGFRGDPTKARCKVAADFVTTMPAGATIKTRKAKGVLQTPGQPTVDLFLDWHGEADAPGKTDPNPVQIPYLAAMGATCRPGRDSQAYLTFKADDIHEGIAVLVETYQGEGPDARGTATYFSDPVTGELQVPLPTNGIVWAYVAGTGTNGGRAGMIFASSWRQLVDEKPAENFCQIAAQAFGSVDLSGGGDIGPA